MVGNQVADPRRRDQQFGQDDADEPGGDAEPQPGEDHRAGVRENDLDDLLEPGALKRLAHLNQGDVGIPDRLEGIEDDDGGGQNNHGDDLGGDADAIDKRHQRDQGGHGGGLHDHENGLADPLEPPVEPHDNAENHPEYGRHPDPDRQRLDGIGIGLEHAPIQGHFPKRRHRLEERREGDADGHSPGDFPSQKHQNDRKQAPKKNRGNPDFLPWRGVRYLRGDRHNEYALASGVKGLNHKIPMAGRRRPVGKIKRKPGPALQGTGPDIRFQ